MINTNQKQLAGVEMMHSASIKKQSQIATESVDRKPIYLIQLTPSRLLLLFVIGSIAGLVIETAYHFFVFGGFESRVGLVWGPFSPLYGVGAVAMTLILNYLHRFNTALIFFASMLTGSTIEYVTSFGMEYLFGAIAWDYSGTFMNIGGRVNLMFALIWGILGLGWARLVMPLMDKGFKAIDWKRPVIKLGAVALAVFMTVNVIVTVQVLEREGRRADGLPAISQVDYFLDEHFPTEDVSATFENMSIYGTKEKN